MIRAVVFDVGETLVDESRIWAGWADWLGVPRHTFSAVQGAMIARGVPHYETFRTFRPDFDYATELGRREAAGVGDWFGPEDLYPDVRPALEALRELGVWTGIAGNQPVRAEADLRRCELPVELLATSAGWGLRKPDPAFFQRLLEEVPCEAGQTLYVGDRLDNDVTPARAAGLRAAWLRRGPHGFIDRDTEAAGAADVLVGGLGELVAWVERVNGGGGPGGVDSGGQGRA